MKSIIHINTFFIFISFYIAALREANEELQAQLFSRGLEEGRTLLNEQLVSNSLAAEFEVMSGDDVWKIKFFSKAF